MNKNILILLVLIGAIVIFVGVQWLQPTPAEPVANSDDQLEPLPSHETAEMVGFAFMQDIIKAAPGTDDSAAADRVYAALSSGAQAEISEETVMNDIAFLVGIQDVPDQGVSVEDLQIHSDTEATLIVGLNYTDSRILRAIELVVEEGVWKVDGVTKLETYPPETGTVTPPHDDEGGAIARDGCYIGGCSAQVCSDDPDVITTCEWLEEYACYRNATCERQADGECGWTETDLLLQCLATAQTRQ